MKRYFGLSRGPNVITGVIKVKEEREGVNVRVRERFQDPVLFVGYMDGGKDCKPEM